MLRARSESLVVGGLVDFRRIAFPFAAAGTAPVVLPCAKAALIATIQAQPLRMLMDQRLDHLHVAPLYFGGADHLRLEQAVQTEQRRIAAHLLADQRGRGIGALPVERQAEYDAEQFGRWVLSLVSRQQAQALLLLFDLDVGLAQPIRSQSEVGRVLRFDPLPMRNGILVAALRDREIALQQRRADAGLVFGECQVEILLCRIEARFGTFVSASIFFVTPIAFSQSFSCS